MLTLLIKNLMCHAQKLLVLCHGNCHVLNTTSEMAHIEAEHLLEWHQVRRMLNLPILPTKGEVILSFSHFVQDSSFKKTETETSLE